VRLPQGELLKVSFYWPARTEAEALRELVAALVSQGARFTGEAYVHRGAGIRDEPFASPTDELSHQVYISDLRSLARQMRDANTRVVSVEMSGATGANRGIVEIVTYVRISESSVGRDRHPLTIRTEGWMFCGTFRQSHARRAKRVGRAVYGRLRLLVERLEPAYAAITIEEFMECPTDLSRGPSSISFTDFYVSAGFLGEPDLSRVRNLFPTAYAEPIADGVYISCTSEFNPAGASVDPLEASFLSVEAGKIIGAAGTRNRAARDR